MTAHNHNDGPTSSCPNCWKVITLQDPKFCPHCGVDLDVWTRHALAPANDLALNAIRAGAITNSFGSRDGGQIQLDHPAVAEHHATLEWRDAQSAWFVIDHGSAAGTYTQL